MFWGQTLCVSQWRYRLHWVPVGLTIRMPLYGDKYHSWPSQRDECLRSKWWWCSNQSRALAFEHSLFRVWKFWVCHHQLIIFLEFFFERDGSLLEAIRGQIPAYRIEWKTRNWSLKSKIIRVSLDKTIEEPLDNANVPCDPAIGSLLLSLATATQKGAFSNHPKVVKAIVDGRIKSARRWHR